MRIAEENITNVRSKGLAGVAVMKEDVPKAMDLVADIGGDVELLHTTGHQYESFVAVDEAGLMVLLDVQELLAEHKLRHSLAVKVPIDDLQSDPVVEDGIATITCCSTNGIPTRTKLEGNPKRAGYRYKFSRPSFFSLKLTVDADTKADTVKVSGTLMGQFSRDGGVLEYDTIETERFDKKLGQKVKTIITRSAVGIKEASSVFHCSDKFLFAMFKSAKDALSRTQRRRGLLSSVGQHKPSARRTSTTKSSVTKPVTKPLTASLGECTELGKLAETLEKQKAGMTAE